MKRRAETKTTGNTNHEARPQTKRILGRVLARELSETELRAIAGAGTSCSNCRPDDCQQL